MSLSPVSGSVLATQSLEPAADSVSPSFSAPLPFSLSLSLPVSLSLSKISKHWGAWVAQSVKCPTSAQNMISRFVSPSPAWGSVLTAQSLEPASDSVSPLSAPPPLCSVSLCLTKINKCKKNLKNKH